MSGERLQDHRSSGFIFLSNLQTLNFLSHFSQELWGLEGWNFIPTWTMSGCIVYTGIRLLLCICHFIFSLFFLSNFQALKCSSRFSQTLWDLQGWNLVHMWTTDGCIMYPRIGLLLLLIHPFICLSHYFYFFLFLQFSVRDMSFSSDSAIAGL